MRLHGFDYARPGPYFVTVCVEDRQCLFGHVVAHQVEMNDRGRMVAAVWHELSGRFTAVETDAFVVMPNHVHGIVHIGRAGHMGPGRGGHMGPALPVIMQWFKTMTTNAYIRGVRAEGWPPFERRLWQRGYYDHIVRDADDLNRIRDYIARNPSNWDQDSLHL